MSIGNLNTQGNKKNNFTWQLAMLQQLKLIEDAIAAGGGGTDREMRITDYRATANGVGYSIGDIVSRTDIIDVATSTIVATIWFNETTGVTIVPPPYTDIVPVQGGGDATAANQVVEQGLIGATNEAAPATDTAVSGLNGRLQRIAQRLTTLLSNVVSTANSSVAPLGIGGVFTGTSEDVSSYADIRVSVFSNQASATNGLSIQQSSDGVNWDYIDVWTIPASTGAVYCIPVYAQFYRIVYTNGGSAQASFRLQTVFHRSRTRPSAIRPQDARTNEIDTEETSVYPMLYNGVTWDRLRGSVTDGQHSTLIDKSASGNITTQNLNPTTGVATVGSTVAFSNISGAGTATIQVTGVYTGALTPQVSIDGTNWVSIANSPIRNVGTAAFTGSILSATVGIFEIRISGYNYFRITALAAVTGTAVVTMRASASLNTIEVTASNSTIGNIGSITGNITPGSFAAHLGKAEDAIHGSGDVGVMSLLLRNDTLTSNTNATNDYIIPTTDQYGAQYNRSVFTAKRTYSTSFIVVAAASATDIFQLIGSGTTSVQVTRIEISGIQTTAGNVVVLVQKRSTANTGGTSSAAVMVPHISTDAAATAVGAIYTANPTTGTPVGNIVSEYVPIGSATVCSNKTIIDFADKGKPVILSGVAQAIAINLNGATITGGSIAVRVEFTEE